MRRFDRKKLLKPETAGPSAVAQRTVLDWGVRNSPLRRGLLLQAGNLFCQNYSLSLGACCVDLTRLLHLEYAGIRAGCSNPITASLIIFDTRRFASAGYASFDVRDQLLRATGGKSNG